MKSGKAAGLSRYCSRNVEGINRTLSEEFVVKGGVYQGSVLSPLFFIMVLEALLCELRSGCPHILICADDLVLIAW